jgi:polyphosphate kinase
VLHQRLAPLLQLKSAAWSLLSCRAVRDILSAQTATLEGSILPELRKHGVSIKTHSELTTSQQASLRAHFKLELEPLLTPLAVDPGHPFPFIKHLSLNIAVLLRDPIDDAHQFAIVTVPSNMPRWKALPQEPGSPANQGVIPLEEIIVSNLDRLFGGMEILSAHPFRATRTMLVLDDLRKGEEDQAEEPADLAAIIAQEMHERKFSPFVRLEVYDSMPPGLVARLAGEMDLDLEQVWDMKTLGKKK